MLLYDCIYAINKAMKNRVLIDTNVFVSALLSQESSPSQVLRLCFTEPRLSRSWERRSILNTVMFVAVIIFLKIRL